MIQHDNKTESSATSAIHRETTWLRECQTAINNTATRHLRHIPRTAATMADNKKQEKDFTKDVDELLSQVDPVVKV